MSKATKRKHVTKEVLDEFVVPDGTHQIVKVHSGEPAIGKMQTCGRRGKRGKTRTKIADHVRILPAAVVTDEVCFPVGLYGL